MSRWAASIQHAFAAAGYSLTTEQRDAFAAYLEELLRWNARINLIGTRDPEGIIREHLVDSALGLDHVPISPGDRVADVGSGAGLPGIPFAVLRPDVSIHLYESRSRKAAFLVAVKARLGLDTITVHLQRFGPHLQAGEPSRFRGIVTRYSVPTPALLRWAGQRLLPEGWVLAYKWAGDQTKQLVETIERSPGVAEVRWIPDPRAVPDRCFLFVRFAPTGS